MNALGNKQIMASNIKKHMERIGISRREFCQRLGFKYSTVTDWLNAEKYPRIDKIEIMANFFGISKADLVEPATHNQQSRPTNGIILSSPADVIVENAAPADLAPTDIPINELIKELFSDRPDVLSVLCTVTVDRDTINDRPLSGLDDTAKDTLRATILDLLEQQGLIAPPKKKLTLSDLTPEERQELKRELYQEEVRKKQERKKEIKTPSAPYTSDEIAN